MNRRTRFFVFSVLVVVTVAFIFWIGAIYVSLTMPVPQAGGQYTEGIASQPRYINPILVSRQAGGADADIASLIYDGLFTHAFDGHIEKDLADGYTVSDDGKTYTVTMHKGAKWHDDEAVTADDVLYTVQTIQDPAYKSPLRINWTGIDVSETDPYTIVFTLSKPYFGFLENLTVGILPKHIWETVPADRFSLAEYNMEPVGSGPYRYFGVEKDSSGNVLSYELRAFPDYFGGAPFIEKFVLRFYPDEDATIDAYARKEVMGVHSVLAENLPKVLARKSTDIHSLSMPRIFAVFFNPSRNAAVAYTEVRDALNLATDRKAIIDSVFAGKADPAYGPLLPFMAGYKDSSARALSANVNQANQELDQKGWVRGADGIRAKGNTVLSLQLSVPDWPELTKTATMISEQWAKVGARVTVAVQGPADLQQQVIRPREYDALLFGGASLADADLYSFWHSSQKKDPGFNLALFDNNTADDLLSTAREQLDPATRADTYGKLQDIFAGANPAVFLYSPKYLYVTDSSVRGIDASVLNTPSDRFSDVSHWYVETKRVWKK